MKTTKKWSKGSGRNLLLLVGMAAMVLAFGLSLSGCSTNKATTKVPNFEKKPIELAGSRPYSVLGSVQFQKKWFGVLGFSIAVGPVATDAYVYQSGGVTYVELLEEARKTYPDADAVVDINIDYLGSTYAVFYAQRTNIVSGIAIKYAKEPSAGNPVLDVKLK